VRALLLVLLAAIVIVELVLIGGIAAVLIWLGATQTIVVGTSMLAVAVAVGVIAGARQIHGERVASTVS
jgi:hypothetical protein